MPGTVGQNNVCRNLQELSDSKEREIVTVFLEIVKKMKESES